MQAWLTTLFPFMRWFPLSRDKLRADLVAGITVALVLVPQSMAYAQLAGLPVVYGCFFCASWHHCGVLPASCIPVRSPCCH